MPIPPPYNLAWRISRPFLPLVLEYRVRNGKEDAARLDERFARYSHRDDLPEHPI